MKCKLCYREIGQGSLKEMFFLDDVICESCRNKFEMKEIKYQFCGYECRSHYPYNEWFSNCLVRYKELYDEALYDIFLYPLAKRLQRIYKGYTIACLPSSMTKLQQRGFSHLKKMCECLNMRVIEPFEKLDDAPQKKKTLKQRMEIDTKIVLKKGVKLPSKIVLFDDVITTGSTMQAVIHALNKQDCDIKIYVLSKAMKEINPQFEQENLKKRRKYI